jgi:YD repeat-containing protein
MTTPSGSGTPDTATDPKKKPPGQPPKPGADQPVNPAASPTDASTNLSHSAIGHPGDPATLAAVRDAGNGKTATDLPGLALTDTHKQPPPQPLSDDALKETVKQLHDAINKQGWHWNDDPDVDKIKALIGPLGQQDCQKLMKLYHDQYDAKGSPDTLMKALHDKLGGDNGVDFRNVQSMLNRSDGRTNDAGALMTAIAQTHHDKERGNADVRAVLETLAASAPPGSDFKGTLEQLDKDFVAQYGMHYQDALKKADLTDATKEALPLLEKGVDKKTPQDVIDLANIAVKHNDAHLFGEALRGDSPAQVEARKQLLSDNKFLESVARAFPSDHPEMYGSEGNYYAQQQYDKLPVQQRIDPVAMDYLTEGRISLTTIATQDTGKWIFNNKENIELACKNASDKERSQFLMGQKLHDTNTQPTTQDQKDALAYYNKIDKVFHDRGNDREASIWEDELAHGRDTIISQMAKTHSDGWGPFSWGAGHSKEDIMSKVETMSADDWKLLHDPATHDQFRHAIEQSLSAYCDKGERDRILALIDKKAAADSPEAAAGIHRNLQDTIADNKGHSFLWWGTSYDAKNILNNVTQMTPEDAARYKNDAAFRKTVDDFVNGNFNDTEKLYAHKVLEQVGSTGQPPKLDAATTFLHDKINGVEGVQLIRDAQALLQDQATRDRLSQPQDKLSADDKTLKSAIEDSLISQVMKSGGYPPEGYGGGYEPDTNAIAEQFIKTGKLTVKQEIDLGFDKQTIVADLAKASPQERDPLMKTLSADEQAVVNHAVANNGQLDLADRMRLFVTGSGGNYQDFQAELKQMNFQQIQALKDEYNKTYKSDLDGDYLTKVDDKDRSAYTQLLTPSTSDGRQTFYDNVDKLMKNSGGFSADGSELTLQKSIDENANLLEEYQRAYQNLPPDKQRQLDDYFNNALEQYKSSKEKLAEIVVDATITAAALAAAPFTGGASIAVVAGIAFAGGAAFRVAAMDVIEGGSFDSSAGNILHQVISGGTAAVLNVMGGKVFEGLGSVYSEVGGKVVSEAAAGSGIASAEQAALQKGMVTLLEQSGKNVTKEEIGALVDKTVTGLTPEARQALIGKLASSAENNYGAIEEAAVAFQKQAAEAAKQSALTHLGKEVVQSSLIGGGMNAVSTLVEAPFNKNGLDMNTLIESTLSGLAVGAVMPVAFKAVGAGGKYVVNLTRGEETVAGSTVATALIDPKLQTEPIQVMRNGELITVKPGDQPFKLQAGDQIVNGPQAPHTDAAVPKPGQTGAPEVTPGGPEVKPVSQTTLDRLGIKTDAEGHLVNERGQRVNEQGRLLDSKGQPIENRFPTRTPAELEPAVAQVKTELAQIKASDGSSVLDKLQASGLDATQQQRVLDSLAQVREHYTINGADGDQIVNWVHTQGELGRVLDAARVSKLTPQETEDALLASMFSDSVKNKGNFTTHHLDGVTAAEQVLRQRLGGDFTEERLNNILHAIKEHQIAPPEFMAMIYTGSGMWGSILAEGRVPTAAEEAAMKEISRKIGDPFGLKSDVKLIDAPGGGKMIEFTPDELALLKRAGVDGWYVPSEGTPWYKISRALIDGDGIDNYATAGGLSKIIQIRGPETGPFFKDGNLRFMEDQQPGQPRRVSSEQSWIDSRNDFIRNGAASPEGARLVEQASAEADAAATRAQARVDQWIKDTYGLDPAKDKIPGWTGTPGHPDNLKYPDYEQRWWSINAVPAELRTPEEVAYYNDPANRYRGLNEQEIKDFQRLKAIRDQYAAELRKEQRVLGDGAPEYRPALDKPMDAVAGRTGKDTLWAPQRDITQLSAADREALMDAIDGKTSPLADKKLADAFAARALQTTQGWTEDLAPLQQRFEDLDAVRLKATTKFQDMAIDEGLPPYETDVVREHVANDPEKLKIVDDYIAARDARNQAFQQLQTALKGRTAQLQTALDEFADANGLPRAKIELVSKESLGAANASYSDGRIKLNEADLLNTSDQARVIGSLYHEFTHGEQDALILRRIADEIGVGQPPTAEQLAQLKAEYKVRTNSSVNDDHLAEVMRIRNGNPLDAAQMARAEAMEQAWFANNPLGKEFEQSGNDFRVTNRELKRLLDESDPNAAYKLVERLSNDRSGTLSEHLFGTKTPPEEVQRFIRSYQRNSAGFDDGWLPEDKVAAEKYFKDTLPKRLQDINAGRQAAYDKYMQVHEYDAWYTGEQARLRAEQQLANQQVTPGVVAPGEGGGPRITPAGLDQVEPGAGQVFEPGGGPAVEPGGRSLYDRSSNTSYLRPQGSENGARQLRLGGNDLLLTPDGKPITIGRMEVDANNPVLHRDQMQVALDKNGNPYISSKYGNEVWIKRKGSDDFVMLGKMPRDGGSNWVGLKYGDEIKIGPYLKTADDVDLSQLTRAQFKIGNRDISLAPGDRVALRRNDINPKDMSISQSKDQLYLGIDQNGRPYVAENPLNPSTNGTWVQRAGQKNWTKITPGAEVHLLPGDSVQVGDTKLNLDDFYRETGLRPQSLTGRLKDQFFGSGYTGYSKADELGSAFRDKDGNLLYTDERGTIIEKPNGNKTIYDPSMATITEQGGLITDVTTATGPNYHYDYTPDGKLRRVQFPGGHTLQTGDGVNWTEILPGGKIVQRTADINVESDGSLHYKDATHEVYYRPDGTTEISTKTPGGGGGSRFEVKGANEKLERGKLTTLAKQSMEPQELKRFESLSADFEKRFPTDTNNAALNARNVEERAQFYHQMNKLLAPDAMAPLSAAERSLLAEQVMLETARPDLIDQGSHSLCNVATVEIKTAIEHPSEFARLVAEVGTTGKYTTLDGYTIDAQQLKFLRPNQDALSALHRPFDGSNFSDLKTDGKPSFADSLFQYTAANAWWSREGSGKMFVDNFIGDALRGADGHTMWLPDLKNQLKRVTSPKLHGEYLTDIYHQITGSNSTDFYFTRDLATANGRGPNGIFYNGTKIDTPYQLGNQLQAVQNRGEVSIIKVNGDLLSTDPSKPYFNPNAKSDPLEPGAHVVVVKSIDYSQARTFPGTNTLDPSTVKVEILNQWGRNQNRLYTPGQDQRATLADLFRVMM